jgi:hypothetical protein
MKIAVMAAGFAVLAATPAFAEANCLELSQIWNWKVTDDKTLIVEDNFHQKFKLSLIGYCPNLPYKENLAFKSFGGTGLSCISKGDQVITHDFAMGGFRCPISNIVPYTPAMENADKAAAAVKAAQQGTNP